MHYLSMSHSETMDQLNVFWKIKTTAITSKPRLSDTYSIVPAVYLNKARTSVPAVTVLTPEQASDSIGQARAEEEGWVQHAL